MPVEEVAADAVVDEVPTPVVPVVADDPLEKLLAEEEEIERRTREQHHEAPHFRREND